jgi:hypothetical protein
MFTQTLVLLAAVSSRDQGRIAAWAAVGACVGLFLFFRGFKMLQLKRLIENTPASKVRSAAMGLVELSGVPVGPSTIPAGITGDPCFYYRATAWERVQSGKNSEWKRVADESLFVPFFLQDETGRTLINAQGADMDVHRNFKDEFGGSFFSSGNMPMGSVEDFIQRYGLSGKHIRLEEHCIKPDYPLFVLGTLGENQARWDDTPERHIAAASSSLSLRLGSRGVSGGGLWQLFGGFSGAQNQVSADGSVAVLRMKAPPLNPAQAAVPQPSSWSSISMDEVHRPVADADIPVAAGAPVPPIARPIHGMQETASPLASYGVAASLPDTPPLDLSGSSGFDLNCPAAVSKGDARAPFTISNESQRELVNSLGWKSTACIWGGPALTVTCVYIFLLTLGLM